jgi:hypothetical protein
MERSYEVRFKDWDCLVVKRWYQNNHRRALVLVDKENGSPIATASVNLPDIMVPPEHVLIKSYSENEGMYEALLKADIIEPSIQTIPTGYVDVYLCKLKI